MRRALAAGRVALLALLALPLHAARGADTSDLYGRPILDLTFSGDAKLDTRELSHLTDLGPGKTLTREALATALRNLYASRRFSDLAVTAAPSGTGVVVVVEFSAAPRITRLQVTGRSVPARGRLLDAAGLGPGDTWDATQADDVRKRVRRALSERGYLEAAVSLDVAGGEDDTSVEVGIHVEPGRRARAGEPQFSSDPAPLDLGSLLKAAKLDPGDWFKESVAREDAVRFETRFRKASRSRAEVRYEGVDFDAASGTAHARYTLFVGPEVRLSVNGAPVSDVTKHPESPWAKGEPPDEETVRRFAKTLESAYQRKGYARARVQVAFETRPDVDLVTFTVDRGERYAIANVSLQGVHSVPVEELASGLVTRPRGFLTVGRVVDGDLAADREMLLATYRHHGYPDARVEGVAIEDAASRNTLDVTFRIEEGAFVAVAERRLVGVEALPQPEVEKLLTVRPGQPFDVQAVDADAARVQAFYTRRGFAAARVESAVSTLPAAPPRPVTATVTYTVREGTALTIGKTVIRGNRRTRYGTIRGALAHEEGQPYSLAGLIETQQNLARLGVFSRVELTPFAADPDPTTRTVLVSVAEAKPWSVLYGVGAEYDREASRPFNPRLSLGVAYNNLFGRAISVGAEGKYSRRENRVVATARDHSIFDSGIPLSVTAFLSEETRPVDLTRRGTFVEVEKQLTKAIRGILRYQYEIVTPDASVPDDILSGLERQNQKIAISSVGPGFTYDTRDDPVAPRRGFYLAADLKWAFPLLSADADFLKSIVQVSGYRRAFSGVLALSMRVGLIESLTTCDTAENPQCLPNLDVPIAERLFAGGRATHRAFPLDLLGIPGRTLRVAEDGTVTAGGGNGLLVANAEWRVPLVGDLGLSVFFDVGNVWADYRDVRLKELRPGVGLGLHYLTPVGPLRLEYGRKLDRKAGESPGELSFSVGYPF